MCLQQYAKVLEDEADRWANTVPGKKCSSGPHPADVILDVLDKIRSRVPRNKLDQIPDLDNLANKVKSSRPNWPSFEFGIDHKDVIDDIRNLAKLLYQSKLKEIPWDNNNPDYITASDAIVYIANNQISSSKLSKLLTPDGPIRYMRKKGPQPKARKTRCRLKVHKDDFKQWAKLHCSSKKTL
ncbi:MAG: hypothetical protein ABIG61_08510 [Planctomycetota bacterium]